MHDNLLSVLEPDLTTPLPVAKELILHRCSLAAVERRIPIGFSHVLGLLILFVKILSPPPFSS